MRESVTFIHAADLHLGAPFQGLSTDNETVGRALAEATYTAWKLIVDAAVARSVDFVVLAGDLYDAADPSLRSQMALRAEAERLHAAGIPLLLVRGNHDPLGGWSAGLALPDSVHQFPSGRVERVEVVADDGFVCAVYGRSFQKAAETSDFTPGYVRDERDTVAVGLLHANVGNNPDHDPYAPCTLPALCACGMDYWALGHIHKHQVLSSEPHVVYAGSPQGLNPKETGAHGFCIVTADGSGVTGFEHISVSPVSWAQATVDVTGIQALDELEATVTGLLEDMRATAGGPVAARLTLTGRTAVHSQLSRPGVLADIVASIRAEQAAASPWVWLDRLTDRTAPPLDLAALAASPDFAGEVVRIADEIASDEARLRAMIDEVEGPIAEKLAGFSAEFDVADLLQAARDRALDLLVTEGGDGR